MREACCPTRDLAALPAGTAPPFSAPADPMIDPFHWTLAGQMHGETSFASVSGVTRILGTSVEFQLKRGQVGSAASLHIAWY